MVAESHQPCRGRSAQPVITAFSGCKNGRNNWALPLPWGRTGRPAPKFPFTCLPQSRLRTWRGPVGPISSFGGGAGRGGHVRGIQEAALHSQRDGVGAVVGVEFGKNVLDAA